MRTMRIILPDSVTVSMSDIPLRLKNISLKKKSAQKILLYDIWGIPKTSVKDIITVNVRVTLRGDSREESYTMALDMVKIYGRWYVYPDYDAFMHTRP